MTDDPYVLAVFAAFFIAISVVINRSCEETERTARYLACVKVEPSLDCGKP